MLVQNWRAIIKRAWSIRLMVLAAILSGAEVAIPYLEGYVDIPPRLFALLSGLTVAAAFIARIVAQKGVSDADK